MLHITSAAVFGCFFALLLSRSKINPLCANEKKGNCSLKPLLNAFPAGVLVHIEKNYAGVPVVFHFSTLAYSS